MEVEVDFINFLKDSYSLIHKFGCRLSSTIHNISNIVALQLLYKIAFLHKKSGENRLGTHICKTLSEQSPALLLYLRLVVRNVT